MKFSSKSNLNSERGFSLISALVSAAIVGVLVLILATLNDNMSKAMLRSNMQRSADNLQRQIAGVLGQRTFCSNAIRGDISGATSVSWAPPYHAEPGPQVPFILFDSNAAPGSKIILASASTAINPATGKPYNQVTEGLFISEIRIQTRDINNDGHPDPVVTHEYIDRIQGSAPQTLIAVPAEIRIKFRGPVDGGGNPIPGSQWVGGAFKSRAIPLVALVNKATGAIVKCDDVVAANRTVSCTGPDARAQALSDMKKPDCEPLNCPAEQPARNKDNYVVVLRGYRSDGTPMCYCQVICEQKSQSWQATGLKPVNAAWPACPTLPGHYCENLGDVCTVGAAGGLGQINTRTCLPY